jgi:SAM-dependent MidA family methyltransferase
MNEANRRFYAEHPPLEAFRTSMVSADLLVAPFLALLETLATPDGDEPLAFVDVGAGDGRLAAALLERLEADRPSWAHRVSIQCIDLRPRPAALDARITWTQRDATAGLSAPIVGIVVAHEWLDDLGIDRFLRRDGALVEVDADGRERSVDRNDDRIAWCDRWWPDGEVIEVGVRRDAAWASLARQVRSGFAIAIDYGHTIDQRPSDDTIAAFAGGRSAEQALDGTVNVTAHVAMDACAAAVIASGDCDTALLMQSLALAPFAPQWGNDAGPRGQLLRAASRTRFNELVATDGLGAHRWLVHAFDVPLPESWSGGLVTREGPSPSTADQGAALPGVEASGP